VRRGAVAAALVGAALASSGCQYLLGPLGDGPVFGPGPGDFSSFDPGQFGSFDPNDPWSALPSPDATYTKGSAVVTIDGETWHLDRLAGTGRMYTHLATDVGWTDGNGNNLHLFGSRGPGGPGLLSIYRIADGQYLGADMATCIPKIDKWDATGISGSASCTDLRWIDMVGDSSSFASASPGPTFDAEITFEATP